ncbi:LOW QUALITY PROTEIN: arrestin domain-containing protein 2 [Drosophila eugracilis]|uniref:LOW QUALITY PROTEIN: arrestin domain-containing protein 2 n=1 Tax=Drosophila eugracilis TaxID=29029 RepID=UPI0007E82106|nr:LOW QUALITY PROTEIN: arrestin domain-containing protein 2 [Drosophila eugracilis]
MGIITQILFHNNTQGVFYAGQTISGQVTLSTDKEIQIKAIRLKVKGHAETHWTESRTDSNNKATSESYSGFEKYLSSKAYLLGSTISTEMSLPPGTRSYNFACQIPINCPSSFEGTHGRILYRVDVIIVQPWKYDSLFSRPFTVIQVMDISTYNSVSQVPVQARTEKTFGVWPFRSDPLTLELNLPQTGFVPGQTVPVNVLVGNESKIRVYEVKVGLSMMITYHCDRSSETNNERKSVAKLKADGVMRNSRKMYDFQLLIPSTPPSCFNLCRIIKIGYQIEVVAKVKGMHINGTLIMPVTICGVPISPQMVQYIPDSSTPIVPVERALTLVEGEGACAPAAPPYPWSDDCTLAPPSYAEAMHIEPERPSQGQQEEENSAEKSYKPLYPVFNVPSPTEEKGEKSVLEKEEKK